MFAPKRQETVKAQEDELLEIYLLIEKNNYQSCKEAAIRYAKLKGISVLSVALVEAKAEYKMFMKG